MVRSPNLHCPVKQNLIEAVTAQSVGRLWENGSPIERPEVQLEPPHPGRLGRQKCIPDSKRLAQGYNLGRKKLAAHLMTWKPRLLDQANITVFLPGGNRGGRTGWACPENMDRAQARVGMSLHAGKKAVKPNFGEGPTARRFPAWQPDSGLSASPGPL